MSLPLEGLRVIELATVVMAPYACQLLGDLGADVIKIDQPAQLDPGRMMGGVLEGGLSGTALNLHRNKRSIALDLSESGDREYFHDLIADADVFVTNLRERSLIKISADPVTLMAVNPRMIYCRTSGFPSWTPRAEDSAVDDTVQAASGFVDLMRQAGMPASFVPTVFADKVAGMTAVYSVLAAVHARSKSDQGCVVEVPMTTTMSAFALVEHLAEAAVPTGEPGHSRILTAERRPFETLNGKLVALTPYTDRQWRLLLEELGEARLLEDERLSSLPSRHRNSDYVYSTLGGVLARFSSSVLDDICRRCGVPFSVVVTLNDLVEESGNCAVLRDDAHPLVGPYRRILPPMTFDGEHPRLRYHAPAVADLGERVNWLEERVDVHD